MVAIDVPEEAAVEDDGLHSRVAFYARYEDAFGQVWETENPADPLGDFEIRRVRPSWRRRLTR